MRFNFDFKRILIYSVELSFCVLGYSQVKAQTSYNSSIEVNYVRVWEASAPESNATVLPTRPLRDVKMSTQYFDGLGRPLQTVVKQGSLETGGSAVDMVVPNLYNVLGQEVNSYLPFAATTTGGNASISDGGFKLNPFQQQAAFMNAQYTGQGESYFYSQVNIEASPLARVLKTLPPGLSWVGSNRGVVNEYTFNQAEETNVKKWTVAQTSGSIPTVTGAYGAGELYRMGTVDEHGNTVYQYSDKNGAVVLKSVQLGTDWAHTFYVYDEFGRLRTVVPPKAVAAINTTWVLTTAIMNELCYRYEYDKRGRLIVKKVPGAEEVRMVYDARDRLVMTQDGNMRIANKWSYVVYDTYNRPIETGVLVNSSTHTVLMDAAYNSISYPSTTGSTVLTKTFYDNYSWLASNGNPFSSSRSVTDDALLLAASSSYPYTQFPTQSTLTKGLPTGSMVNVLESTQNLYTISYYDEYGRMIQCQKQTLNSGVTIVTNQYSYSGQLLSNYTSTKISNTGATIGSLTKYEHDDLGRISLIKKQARSSTGLNSAEKVLVQSEYDKLGQLKKKTFSPGFGTSGLESLQYEYNVRGWLLGANRNYTKDQNSTNYFGFDLAYDKISGVLVGAQSYSAAQYNGNIAGMTWKSKGDGEKRKYDFTYDGMNRLLKADFTQYTSGTFNKSAGFNFDVKMGDGVNANTAYDLNGNILRMQQFGYKLSGSAQIDDLTYTYATNSNKLVKVTDAFNDAATKLGDFKDGSNATTDDYTFDNNGNTITDQNKDITSISYNILNLPQVVIVNKTPTDIEKNSTITYTYDASGNKLRKVVLDKTVTPNKITTTLYAGGQIYENDVLQLIGHEEGRIRFVPADGSTAASFQFDYMLKDHLGNVRMVLTDEQKVEAYPAATMETATSTAENLLYANINSTRSTKPAGYPADSYSSPNTYAAKTSGSGNKLGPAIILKVMAGDKFNVRVSSWYKTGGVSPQTPTSALNDLVSALTNSFANMASSKGGPTATEFTSSGLPSNVANSFLTSQTTVAGRPKAYLNWILVDEQFKFVSGNPDIVGANETFKIHQFTDLPVTKNGYLYVYVSNETPNIDVYFDNLQVTLSKGQILEETHYYPFGLTMAGISAKTNNSLINYLRWNAASQFETQELINGNSLDIYSTFYRSLDPQLGRFLQIDPYANIQEDYSPYQSMDNNPIINVDPLGDFATRMGAWWHRLWHGGGKIEKNEYGEWSVTKTKIVNSTSSAGVTTTAIVAYRYYGEGRNQYSNAGEDYLRQEEMRWDIFVKGDRSIYKEYPSQDEANRATINLAASMVLPNPFLKGGTLFANKAKFSKEILLLESQRMRMLRIVQNPKLRSWIEKLWRAGAKYGDGSTGAIIKLEKSEGVITSASGSHVQKGEEALAAMAKFLKGNYGELCESDRQIVFEVIQNLTDGTGLSFKK
ncbi:MAG: hypothetical protein K2P88_07870 [Chitinophagaceae bacterium]|nr:hypothetical protein [Chitinophagaceae bacterium]